MSDLQGSSIRERYAQLLPVEKAFLLLALLFFFPGCVYAIVASLGSSSTQMARAPGGLPASWREACDYVYTFGAGRLDDEHCVKMIRDRPVGMSEAERVWRIKISNQQSECIRTARTEQGKDACRMQYPTNW